MNTVAVILRRDDFNGADCRLTLYTEVAGKVEAVARGLKKGTSKLAAHLEPLTSTEVFLIAGKWRKLVGGSVVISRYQHIRDDLIRLFGAGAVLRIVDLMAPYELRDDNIFQLLQETLNLFNDRKFSNSRLGRLPYFFAWKLLVFSGYRPELKRCLRCRRRSIGSAVRLDPRYGGPVHRACLGDEHATSIPVSATVLKGLSYMIEAPISDTLRLSAGGSIFQEIQAVIEALVEERFEVDARSRFWNLRI